MSIGKRVSVLALLLCSSIALAGCFGKSKKGPQPSPLPVINSSFAIKQAWNLRMGEVNFPLVPRVLSGNRVLLADSKGTVWMLNAANGNVLWQTALGVNLTAGVGSDGNITAVVSRDNDLIALDEQGKEIWRKRITSQVLTPPLVGGGRIFLSAADHSILAFDASNGSGLWRQQQNTPEALVLRRDSVLDAYENTLILGLTSNLYGVDPDTGAPRWGAAIGNPRGTNEVDRLADLVGGAARNGDIFCACSYQNAIACVKNGGEVLWSKSSSCESGVAVDPSRLYEVESNGRIYALDQSSGNTVWVNEQLRYRHLSAPLVLGDRTLVIGDLDGNVHLLSREDGSFLGRLTTNSSGIEVTPVAVGNMLVIVTKNGTVYGFSPE